MSSSSAPARSQWSCVAFIGLGNMGMPMARRLLEAGVGARMVVYNRSKRDGMDDLVKDGAKLADDLGALIDEVSDAAAAGGGDKQSAAVHMMLSDDKSSKAVLEQLIAGGEKALPKGTVLINHASVSVDSAREFAQLCGRAGVVYLTATVTGRPPAAAAGELLVWLSCDRDDEATCKRVRESLLPPLSGAVKTIDTADVTRAAAYKILTNFLVYAAAEIFGELSVIFEANGISPKSILDWTESLMPNTVYAGYAQRIVERDFELAGGAGLDIALKDLKLAKQMAEGADAPVLDATLRHVQGQVDSLKGGNLDWSSIVEEIERCSSSKAPEKAQK